MNIKCPNCGAVHSLDTLINDADASAVLKAVLDMDAELGNRPKREANNGNSEHPHQRPTGRPVY